MAEVLTFNNVIGVLINAFAHFYIWSKLFERSFPYKKIKYYLLHILLAIFMMGFHLLVNDVIRIILLSFILIFICKNLFKENLITTVVAVFFAQMVQMFAELLFVFILMLLFKNIDALIASPTSLLYVNIFVVLFSIFLVQLGIVKKTYNIIIKLSKNINKTHIIFIMIISLISINFVFLATYFKYNLSYIIVITTIISIVYLIICFKFLNAESKYNNISNKYSTTLNSLREYEEILDAYRVSNHENKNQLLTIRSMIVKKDKNIPDYIDKLIDNKIKDDEKLMFDTNAIPSGGLRAVIYSKLLVMKDKKIKFSLNVDRKVRTVELIELGEDLMLDICKIIGVFLDNAIEATIDLKKKNIAINLFINQENLNIEISNNFEGSVDLNKLDEKGYTSKSKGHGYGLSLVKEILAKNPKLVNERQINRNVFIQKLKICLK